MSAEVEPFWFCSGCGDSFSTNVRDTCPTCFPRMCERIKKEKHQELMMAVINAVRHGDVINIDKTLKDLEDYEKAQGL